MPPAEPKTRLSKPQRHLFWLARLLLVGCAAAFFAGAGARVHWSLDLFSHFTLQLLEVVGVLTVVIWVVGTWRWRAFSVILGLALMWRMAPAAPPHLATDPDEPAIRLLLANIMIQAPESEAFASYIERTEPDVLVLLELDAVAKQRLAHVLDDFPFQHVALRGDSFGIGVFSRLPLLDPQVIQWPECTPAFLCGMTYDDQRVEFVAAHPCTPMSRLQSRCRNRQLQRVAEHVRHSPHPTIVVGDLNCTPWSPHFRDLLKHGGLRDSRRTWQIHPTWPAALPWPLRIPIDHVLINERLSVRDRSVGPTFSSDHLPVLVELEIR